MTVNINKRFALTRIVCLAATLALLAGAVTIHTTFAAPATSQATAPAATVTVPTNVKPVKSYKAEVGKSYSLPKAVKQTGDTYASSATATMTVDAATGAFKPVKNGTAYIVATNAGQKRYIKITVGTATAEAKPAASTAKTNIFAGYTITVTDKTTPAVDMRGDNSTMYFISADGTKVGSMTRAGYLAVIKKYETKITLPSGASYTVPPVGESWNAWLAQNYNVYRGLEDAEVTGTLPAQIENSTANTKTVDIEAYRQEVFRLTNLEREKAGVPLLELDDTAMEFAQIRAEELSIKYSHTRPDGTVMMYGSLGFGENIGMGQKTPTEIITDWMNSPGHKAAMLGEYSDYGNRAGFGVYQDSNGKLYWVQEFIGWDADA